MKLVLLVHGIEIDWPGTVPVCRQPYVHEYHFLLVANSNYVYIVYGLAAIVTPKFPSTLIIIIINSGPQPLFLF